MGGKLKSGRRVRLAEAKLLAYDMMLRLALHVERIEVAGSIRRGKLEVGDIEFVVVPKPGAYEWCDSRNFTGGFIKRSGLFKGVQIDLNFCKQEEFGACMLYATGAADFNIRMRILAKSQGLKLNRYGLWNAAVDNGPHAAGEVEFSIAGKTEQDIFDALGIKFVDPFLRVANYQFRLVDKSSQLDDWVTENVASSSGVGSYTVKYSPSRDEGECGCRGYEFRGTCRHLKAVKARAR